MIKIKKHISLFFLLVYLSPIVFQSIHVIQHQFDVLFVNSHCHNHACCHNNFDDNSEELFEDSSCIICEYQFPVKDFNFNNYILFQTDYIISIFNDVANGELHSFSPNQKSPRAPPII